MLAQPGGIVADIGRACRCRKEAGSSRRRSVVRDELVVKRHDIVRVACTVEGTITRTERSSDERIQIGVSRRKISAQAVKTIEVRDTPEWGLTQPENPLAILW